MFQCLDHFIYLVASLLHILLLQDVSKCRIPLLCRSPSTPHSNLHLRRLICRTHLLDHQASIRHIENHQAKPEFLFLLDTSLRGSIVQDIKCLLAVTEYLGFLNHRYQHLLQVCACQIQIDQAPIE